MGVSIVEYSIRKFHLRGKQFGQEPIPLRQRHLSCRPPTLLIGTDPQYDPEARVSHMSGTEGRQSPLVMLT